MIDIWCHTDEEMRGALLDYQDERERRRGLSTRAEADLTSMTIRVLPKYDPDTDRDIEDVRNFDYFYLSA